MEKVKDFLKDHFTNMSKKKIVFTIVAVIGVIIVLAAVFDQY